MKEFEKWFAKAENDLLSIANNLNANQTPVDSCCFHAQQAAEKYLKAFLIAKNVSFPKTHDLVGLIELCKIVNSGFDAIKDAALRLTDYAIAPRYPDAFDDLNIDDAKIAYQDALLIKQFILNNLFQ